jgi:hypothetical protein
MQNSTAGECGANCCLHPRTGHPCAPVPSKGCLYKRKRTVKHKSCWGKGCVCTWKHLSRNIRFRSKFHIFFHRSTSFCRLHVTYSQNYCRRTAVVKQHTGTKLIAHVLPLSSSPHTHSFVLGTAVINTHMIAPPWVGSRSPDGWDQIPRWVGGWVLHQPPWSFGFDSQTRGTRENRRTLY